MTAVRLRARALLRGNVAATVVLALLVGLAGGAVLGGWAAARRAGSALERFEAYTDAPAFTIMTCGPRAEPDPETGGCSEIFVPEEELAFVRSLREVRGAALAGLFMARVERPGGEGELAPLLATGSTDIETPSGRPLIVAGRLFDASAPDEVVVTEDIARAAGLSVGDVFAMRGFPRSQGISFEEAPEGAPFTLRVVGIARFPGDLRASELSADAVDGVLLVGPAWFAAHADELTPFGIGIDVRTESAAAVRAALVNQFSDRGLQFEQVADEEEATVRDAVSYEVNAQRAVTAAVLVAAVAVLGLALVRQLKREEADRFGLSAIGFTSRQAAASAVLRLIPVALGAMAVAAGIAVVSSSWTPVGLAARAEVAPGVHLDPLVLGVGVPLVGLAVVGLGGLASVIRRDAARAAYVSSAGAGAAALGLPSVAVVGVSLAFPGRKSGRMGVGSSVAAVSIAVAAALAAATVTTSLDVTLADPARYGATWDATLEGPLDLAEEQAFAGRLREDDRIVAAAGQLSSPVAVDGIEVDAFTGLDPAKGDSIRPVIPEGREPARPGEIALAADTMRQIGKGIGDEVEVSGTLFDGTRVSTTALVVGWVVMNDAFSVQPGTGALVTGSWLRELVPTDYAQQFVVTLAPGLTVDDLRDDYMVTGNSPPAALRNLDRVHQLPWYLVMVVLVLGGGTLLHSLLSSVRRQHAQLAVLRSLGYTRRQVRRTVLWESIALGLAGLAVGVPAGIMLGRWGWHRLASSVGVAVSPVVQLPVVLVVAVVLLAASLLVAVWPAHRATRIRAAAALRAG